MNKEISKTSQIKCRGLIVIDGIQVNQGCRGKGFSSDNRIFKHKKLCDVCASYLHGMAYGMDVISNYAKGYKYANAVYRLKEEK